MNTPGPKPNDKGVFLTRSMIGNQSTFDEFITKKEEQRKAKEIEEDLNRIKLERRQSSRLLLSNSSPNSPTRGIKKNL